MSIFRHLLPVHGHPLDPPAQHKAAFRFGRHLARRVAEAEDILPYLVLEAIENGYRGDMFGLACRLAWSLRDGEAHWLREADRVRWAIRDAMQPMLSGWASLEDMIAQAGEINEPRGRPLSSCDLRRFVGNQADRFCRNRRR